MWFWMKTMMNVLDYLKPDETIGQIEKFAKVGMNHIVLCNMTFFFTFAK